MKKFDPASIYARSVDKLSQNPDWKAIISDSVVTAILKQNAEELSEMARYSEYLFKESKWDTAQNTSSITAQAGQLGYKPARKRSAFGELYISADPRTHLVGRQIFKNDFLDMGNSQVESALRSVWATTNQDLVLNRQATVTDSNGVSYVITSNTNLPPNTPFSLVSVMQGIRKRAILPIEVIRTTASRSKLDPYIYIPILVENCENAGLPFSRQFFRVLVNTASGSTEYRVTDTLHFSESYDFDVEVFPDLYNVNLLYLKFNGSPQRGRPLNISPSSGIQSIELQYVETLGSAGNLSRAFEPFTITNIPGASNTTLYGINLESIIGGMDEESVFEIKKNAPLFYLSTYTAATREAYENLISRISFEGGVFPSKVRVFSGIDELGDGIQRLVTFVSLIAPALEDKLSNPEENFSVADIERTINFYLNRLKAPSDIIRFRPPNYTRFGVGLFCTAASTQVTNLSALRENIRDVVDAKYGSGSLDLDFNRPVYEADIIAAVKQDPAILSVKTEVEAIQQLSWSSSRRIRPIAASPIHTIRMDFSFNPLYRGRNFIKGFKDFKTGASYVLRFDVMFRQGTESSLPPYHTSLFIRETPNRATDDFYIVRNTSGASSIWDPNQVEGGLYPFPGTATTQLTDSYQFYFKKRVFTDDAFERLISRESLEREPSLDDPNKTPGMLSDFVVYFSGDYDDDTGSIGSGYIEIDITSIYTVLQRYAEQDSNLLNLLLQYPLSNVKCDQVGDIMEGFKRDVLGPYVDIFVSARPLDRDLIPDASEESGQQNVVLYIDTQDDMDAGALTNLSTDKRTRFLSVETELV